jgi:hypothetical protein
MADAVKHCATCVCGRRAPVQRSRNFDKPAGSIAWWEHEKAWEKYGYSQSAERIAERGGFSYGELVQYLDHEPTTWSIR